MEGPYRLGSSPAWENSQNGDRQKDEGYGEELRTVQAAMTLRGSLQALRLQHVRLFENGK